MKSEICLIRVEQPIGSLFVGKISTSVLLKICYSKNRKYDRKNGYQRDLSVSRIKDMAKYIDDPDATFPTALILSINEKNCNLKKLSNDLYKLEFDDENKKIIEIIDGQHRIEALRINPNKILEVPIVITFDLDDEDKAYIFSVINSNQRKVPVSLIYDLFDLYINRSPYKTCHNIAKGFNCDGESAFYKRLKMLGFKEEKNESLTQGTFVSSVSGLITDDSNRDAIDIKNNDEIKELDVNKFIFRNWFKNNNDSKIYKVLNNYFKAVSFVFNIEWEDYDKYILSKTTGFCALCKALPIAYHIGLNAKKLDFEIFKKLFEASKKYFNINKILLTSDFYGSGEAAQNKLKEEFIKSWDKFRT